MKINELKESFADWASGAMSRDSRSVAAGSKAVQKQFIKDFTEDFRNALDSAIRSGYIRIGPPGVTLDPNKETPTATAKDLGLDEPDMNPRKASAADFGITEAQFKKLNYIFESIIALNEEDGQASISEWGIDWFKKYMQNYAVDKYLPTATKIFKSMESAYQQQGIKGKMQGLIQFNQALNQLSQLAWAVERSGMRPPQGQPSFGSTGGGSGSGPGGSPTGGLSPDEVLQQRIYNSILQSRDPASTLSATISKFSPAAKLEILNGLEKQLLTSYTPSNDPIIQAVQYQKQNVFPFPDR